MSTQQSESQQMVQHLTHTDFIVRIATENASLKVQIKQEYDNSCAIAYQINKSTREINSCKRDLNKFKEIYDAKNSELKRLEADLDSSHLSRERIRNNIEQIKRLKDNILSEEIQKRLERDSNCESYERMIENQKKINSSHPLVMKKDSMYNTLKKYEIQLALLRNNIEDWRKKDCQIRIIQSMKLNVEVVGLAEIITKRRMEYRKKISLANQLEIERNKLQKLIESKQNQNMTKVTSENPSPSVTVIKNMSALELTSHIKQSFHKLSGSIAEQSDLMKHLQQVSAFKTPHNQPIFSSKFSRFFSSHNYPKRKLSFGRMVVDHQPSKSSEFRLIGEKVKNIEESNKFIGTKNLNSESVIESLPEMNVITCSHPIENVANSQDSNALNNEIAVINSGNDVSQPTDISSNDVITNCEVVASQAPSCRSNCSTPVSVRNVGSQKGKSDRRRLKFSILQSPRPVDSARISVAFSPIRKASLTPKMISKQSRGPVSSRKPYRTPDILQKISMEKCSFMNNSSCSLVSSRLPKQTKTDMDTNLNLLKTKCKNSTPGACTDARQVEGVTDGFTKFDVESNSEIRNVKKCPSTHTGSSLLADSEVKDLNSKKENDKVCLNKEKNMLPRDTQVPDNEANQSKYFSNVSPKTKETMRSDENSVIETHQNLQSNDENIFSCSVDGTSKANSTGSNSSHFSSIIMQGSGDNAPSPMENFTMPFSSSGNEGIPFSFGNSNRNDGFTLSGGFTSTDTSSNPFLFNITNDKSKPVFNLF